MVNLIEPRFDIETEDNKPLNGMAILKFLEKQGRKCWQSESNLLRDYNEAIKTNNKEKISKILFESNELIRTHFNKYGRNYAYIDDLSLVTDASALKFVYTIFVDKSHTSVIEHSKITVNFIVNRGFSHELVRHRLASFSQESTRYCNYSKNGQLNIITPFWKDKYPKRFQKWLTLMKVIEDFYIDATKPEQTEEKMIPQEARDVLTNGLKTEIVTTANIREWAESLQRLRTDKVAHPDMLRVMIPLFKELRSIIPIVFDYKIKIVKELNTDY